MAEKPRAFKILIAASCRNAGRYQFTDLFVLYSTEIVEIKPQSNSPTHSLYEYGIQCIPRTLRTLLITGEVSTCESTHIFIRQCELIPYHNFVLMKLKRPSCLFGWIEYQWPLIIATNQLTEYAWAHLYVSHNMMILRLHCDTYSSISRLVSSAGSLLERLMRQISFFLWNREILRDNPRSELWEQPIRCVSNLCCMLFQEQIN